MPLTFAEEHRYSRHLILPQVGLSGQERLKAARVLLVGAGGLGSPAALYLAAAGVGTISIADGDVVDVTNLQRQVLHRTADVGRPKVASAAEALAALNPLVRIIPLAERISADNASAIIADYDVVIDGTDNFPTRYLLNDACALAGKPLVFGSVYRFEGHVSVFDAQRGPCYRCLFPEPPAPEHMPSCAEGGVLGVLPGIIGSMQATQALLLILGIGEPLRGRLLTLDALTMRVREFTLPKNPDCPLCGDTPTITSLQDYQAFCGLPTAISRQEWEMSADEVQTRLAAGTLRMVDVRDEDEREGIAGFPQAQHLPYPAFTRRMAELDSGADLVLYCSTGLRSGIAVGLLRRAGFTRAWSMRGGLAAWSDSTSKAQQDFSSENG